MIKKKRSEICWLQINIHLLIDKPSEQIMIQSFLLWNKKTHPKSGDAFKILFIQLISAENGDLKTY